MSSADASASAAAPARPAGMPRLVIAAPASGHGKTTIATGLIAAFAARGRRVAPFKVGPDYIDPGYHALAAGRPGRNLDPFLVGEERVRDLFGHGSAGADLAIVEGVMGLYDGAAGRGRFASTAHVAQLIDAPVLLVVDAAAQGRSIAALAHGFRSFDPRVRLAGVILNRIGSDRHRQILDEALEEIGLPVLGALRRSDAAAVPARHLGLVPVAERAPEAVAVVRALAELTASALDLDRIERIAAGAPALPVRDWTPQSAMDELAASSPTPRRELVVAVAAGPAFTFSYAEHAELLAAGGARVAPFDPLHDEKLPDGTAALVIGGGFPEVYAPALSANEPLREQVRALAERGGVIAAECAGLLYLASSLDDAPMCGVLDVHARMTDRLTLGYREAVAPHDSVLCEAGARVSGHEFHRTRVEPGSGAQPAWLWQGARDGFVQGGVHASYLHTHWAGQPGVVRRLLEAAACAA
ncbi:MAG TPA: cobyrinate a,c-diamide synthase [Actinocrinis sp.]|nr:cobyrinate a,c-diamide synthase [Actinocrinis sp.]